MGQDKARISCRQHHGQRVTGGRPLRFLIASMAGWAVVRAAMMWPVPSAVIERAKAIAARSAELPAAQGGVEMRRAGAVWVQPAAGMMPLVVAPGAAVSPLMQLAAGERTVAPLLQRSPQTIELIAPPRQPSPAKSKGSRFSGSAWLIARSGQTRSLLGGQLGASQAGLRVAYALGEARRVAITARIATPLSGRGREAAIGLEWKPTKAPVRIFAEERLSLDGGRGGPTAGAITGLDPTPVVAGFRLEAYGQAGVIARDGMIGFADGAARMTRPVGAVSGIGIDVGAGAWGGVQPGASRVDVGPTIGVAVPVAGKSVRLTLDYRARIAGSAKPGSGIALSIGTDF